MLDCGASGNETQAVRKSDAISAQSLAPKEFFTPPPLAHLHQQNLLADIIYALRAFFKFLQNGVKERRFFGL